MVLRIKWTEFTDKIDEFLTATNELHQFSKTVKDETELNELEQKIKTWTTDCTKFLKDSFDSETNKFAHDFYYSREGRYNIPGTRKGIEDLKKETIEDLKNKSNTLDYYKKILSVCDAIIKPDTTNLKVRENYTTEQVLTLILEKLFDLYDDYYHPISTILWGNGIILKRYDEERELIQILEDQDYVKVTHTRTITAQLTAQGKIYVENLRKKESINYGKISESSEELDKKIDEIKTKLWKLGLGQEIIFNELEELKEFYKKADKKNWGQLLKGKLVDLGLSKLVDNDTISYIYKELTHEILRLQ
jgi:hypothetical protein